MTLDLSSSLHYSQCCLADSLKWEFRFDIVFVCVRVFDIRFRCPYISTLQHESHHDIPYNSRWHAIGSQHPPHPTAIVLCVVLSLPLTCVWLSPHYITKAWSASHAAQDGLRCRKHVVPALVELVVLYVCLLCLMQWQQPTVNKLVRVHTRTCYNKYCLFITTYTNKETKLPSPNFPFKLCAPHNGTHSTN